jgi:hypothetical protein
MTETEVKKQGFFNRKNVTFNRSIRVVNDAGEQVGEDLAFTLASDFSGVVSTTTAYKLPGFDDAAQVRRMSVDVEEGKTEVQLKIYQVTQKCFKRLVHRLKDAGWKVVL